MTDNRDAHTEQIAETLRENLRHGTSGRLIGTYGLTVEDFAEALLPVVARIKAEAWDEGYVAADFAVHRGIANPCAVVDRGNPYCAEASGEGQ